MEAAPIVGDADAPGEHQRVGGEGGVVEHRAGDGRQADLVAVVGDAVDHALADAQRVEGAVGDVGERDVGWPEAQDVGDRDRAVGGTEHVADHAADAGVGAAERFDRRRVVVGLGLERDRRAWAVRHDAGVADERRPHERGGDGVGATPQHGEQRWPFVAGVGHERRPERLVRAVFAPRLGDRLELDVGRITTLGDEVLLHGQQLVGIEGEGPIDADLLERGSRQLAHGNDGRGAVGSPAGREVGLDGSERPALDDRVGDDAAHDVVGGRRVDGATELDPATGRGDLHRHPELGGGVHQGGCRPVGDAGEVRDLDAGCRGCGPRAALQQRIDEEVLEGGQIVPAQRPVDEHQVGDDDLVGIGRGQAELFDGGDEGPATGVGIDRRDGQSVPSGHCADPRSRRPLRT